MKIQKTTPPTRIYLAKGESNAWRWAALVFAGLAALALTSCASTPPSDQAALQQELNECRSLLNECAGLLTECEGFRE